MAHAIGGERPTCPPQYRPLRRVIAPAAVLCTNSGAMIVAAGYRRLASVERAELAMDVEPGLRI